MGKPKTFTLIVSVDMTEIGFLPICVCWDYPGVIAFGKPKTFTLSMSVDSTRVSHWAVIPPGDPGGEKDLLLVSCASPPPHFSLLLPISALFLRAPWVRACLFCRLQFSGLEITSHSALSCLLALGASLYPNSTRG